MKKTKIMLMFVIVILFLGCASQPISQHYPERWNQTYIGMSFEDFKELWPESKGGGSDMQGNPVFTVIKNPPFVSRPSIAYFGFQDNLLTGFSQTY
jgi:hypothetical protein